LACATCGLALGNFRRGDYSKGAAARLPAYLLRPNDSFFSASFPRRLLRHHGRLCTSARLAPILSFRKRHSKGPPQSPCWRSSCGCGREESQRRLRRLLAKVATEARSSGGFEFVPLSSSRATAPCFTVKPLIHVKLFHWIFGRLACGFDSPILETLDESCPVGPNHARRSPALHGKAIF